MYRETGKMNNFIIKKLIDRFYLLFNFFDKLMIEMYFMNVHDCRLAITQNCV